ncbi:MAG: hypothetical protein AB1806_21525 [Acidobacteriota bacterium]
MVASYTIPDGNLAATPVPACTNLATVRSYLARRTRARMRFIAGRRRINAMKGPANLRKGIMGRH